MSDNSPFHPQVIKKYKLCLPDKSPDTISGMKINNTFQKCNEVTCTL